MPFKSERNGSIVSITMTGEIGSHETDLTWLKAHAMAPAASGENFELVIHSAGGDVDMAVAMYRYLQQQDQSRFSTRVHGQAFSAATLPYLAADRRLISSGSEIMVHAPTVQLDGNLSLDDLLAAAYELQAAGGKMRDIYQERAGLKWSEANSLLDGANHRFMSYQAIQIGLATEIDNRTWQGVGRLDATSKQGAATIGPGGTISAGKYTEIQLVQIASQAVMAGLKSVTAIPAHQAMADSLRAAAYNSMRGEHHGRTPVQS